MSMSHASTGDKPTNNGGHLGGNIRTRRELPIVALVVLTLADVLLTLQFWHLETNPVVLGLGATPWAVVKGGLVLIAVFWWYKLDVHRSNVALVTVLGYVLLVCVVLGLNLTEVLGLGVQ